MQMGGGGGNTHPHSISGVKRQFINVFFHDPNFINQAFKCLIIVDLKDL